MELGFEKMITIPIILILGILIGLVNGVLIAKVGVPSFVVTLTGMLIFRGALIQVTEKTRTIIIKDDHFNVIGNGFIPSIMEINGLHLLTLLVGFVGILVYIYNEITNRRNKLDGVGKVTGADRLLVQS